VIGVDTNVIVRLLQRFRSSSADFADCLIGVNNVGAGCEYTATFDRKASKHPEFQLIS
jgi:predicted nucleic-acid-binding protein